MSEQGFTISSSLPGVTNKVRLEDLGLGRFKIDVQTTTAISQSFLDARAAERAHARDMNGGRAPRGDSHGAWTKIAEIPLNLLMTKIPPDSWEDQAALRKLINDPDFAHFRSDVEKRTF
jgi:hypothetical protein